MSESAPVPLGNRDNDTMNLRVTRSVPVWSIVTGLVFVVAQAVALQLGQSRLNELIDGQTRIITQLNSSIEATNKELRSNQFEIFKHETSLKDLERRVNTIERSKEIAVSQQNQELRLKVK